VRWPSGLRTAGGLPSPLTFLQSARSAVQVPDSPLLDVDHQVKLFKRDVLFTVLLVALVQPGRCDAGLDAEPLAHLVQDDIAVGHAVVLSDLMKQGQHTVAFSFGDEDRHLKDVAVSDVGHTGLIWRAAVLTTQLAHRAAVICRRLASQPLNLFNFRLLTTRL
jgi:hypothetical protein